MQSSTKPFPADGSPLTCDAGSYRVMLIPTIDGGFTLRVLAGPHEHAELADQFTDETLARAEARRLTTGLRAGTPIHQFIADRLAAERDLIASVSASMDAATKRYLAPRNAARQIAAEVVTGEGPAWRAQVRRNANLGAYAHGTPNQRTRHLPVADFKDVHRRAMLAANEAGEIRVGPGVATTTLRILAEAGYGRIVPVPGARRYQIAKLQLNLRGLNAAKTIFTEGTVAAR